MTQGVGDLFSRMPLLIDAQGVEGIFRCNNLPGKREQPSIQKMIFARCANTLDDRWCSKLYEDNSRRRNTERDSMRKHQMAVARKKQIWMKLRFFYQSPSKKPEIQKKLFSEAPFGVGVQKNVDF